MAAQAAIDARKRGYQAVVLHLGGKKADQYGIASNLRGLCINDEAVGEMYVIADEDEKVVYKNSKNEVNRFAKVFVHEMSHWFAKTLKQKDETHYWDYERENVMLAMSSYSWPVGLIGTITNALRKEYVTLPVPMNRITQHFLEKSDWYKSGVHSGTDIALPVGTPVRAPTDGRVVLTWRNHKTLGNACTYEWHYNGKMYTLRLAHLASVPKAGGYKRGDTIAYTGNTGASTGAHLHIEVWKGGYNVDVLYSESLMRSTLLNPYVFLRGITR